MHYDVTLFGKANDPSRFTECNDCYYKLSNFLFNIGYVVNILQLL